MPITPRIRRKRTCRGRHRRDIALLRHRSITLSRIDRQRLGQPHHAAALRMVAVAVVAVTHRKAAIRITVDKSFACDNKRPAAKRAFFLCALSSIAPVASMRDLSPHQQRTDNAELRLELRFVLGAETNHQLLAIGQ